MIRHAGSPDLYTRRLRLRAYRPEDYRQMFDNWAGDPQVTDFLNWGPHANAEITRQLVSMWVEGYQSPTVYRWGIFLSPAGGKRRRAARSAIACAAGIGIRAL